MNETRFKFGENWSNYSSSVNLEKIELAKKDIIRLVGDVSNKSVIDIGCGSGIHTVAFIQLGVKSIVSFDYDLKSVETTKKLVKKFCYKKSKYKVFQADILNIDSLSGLNKRKFDIVYSWGVLHHTGSMFEAIISTTKFLKDNGILVLGLYVKTKLCNFWYYEKKIFNKYKFLQPLIKLPFLFFLIIGLSLKKRSSPYKIIHDYKKQRGMSIIFDVNDWLGGFPYESIDDNSLLNFLKLKGFKIVRKFNTNSRIGFFGAACGEWVLKKNIKKKNV